MAQTVTLPAVAELAARLTPAEQQQLADAILQRLASAGPAFGHTTTFLA